MMSGENQIENFKQMVRNAITARLRVLETTENNISELKAAESETERILGCQVLQMLEEHSVENEAWVDAFSTARNQSPLSDSEAQEFESLDNLRGQILREMLPIILELSEELGNYYGRIRESLEEIYPELPAILASLDSSCTTGGNYIISLLDWQVIEQELLRKYLEVETAINDQNN
jgi:hypothetical protein